MEFPGLFTPSEPVVIPPGTKPPPLKRKFAMGPEGHAKRLRRQNANVATTGIPVKATEAPEVPQKTVAPAKVQFQERDNKAIAPYFEYFGLPVYKFAYGKFIHAEKVDGQVRFFLGEWNHVPGIGWSAVPTKRIGLTIDQFFMLSAAVILGRGKNADEVHLCDFISQFY